MINKIINSINPIILDFDYTLFDANVFKQATIDKLADLDITKYIYYQTYEQIRNKPDDEYLPLEHCKLMGQLSGVNFKKIQNKYDEVISNSRQFLYPDVIEFLDKLTKQKIPLYLLTFGNPIFQKQKVEASGIAHYFKKTIYTSKDKYSVADKIPSANHATFINDNPHEIQPLQTRFPKAKFIQIKRENGKEFELKLKDIILINQFSEIN